ncbi:MAG TPA: hypothetical protein DDW27_01005 [Bacteroidales bacterium]|nr:hypothetical protein [Bacteroidales bacterium]
MRILFIINTLGTGGKERRLTELLRVLKSRNETDFILVTMSRDVHYKELFDIGIDIRYLLRGTKKDISIFRKLYNLCREYDPDILHCWDSMSAIYSAGICRLLQIIFINGMVTNAPARQNIFNKHWLRARLTFPLADYIIGNSNAGLKAYRAPERKSRTIYNGFNFDRIKHLVPRDVIKRELQPGESVLVGMVASHSVNKDYKTFIEAAQKLLMKRRDIIFLAIGKDTDSDDLRRHINQQFTGNFRLLGIKTGVESYINVLDICVLSTFTEGISNSVLEYMALGKPVIASSGGGTGELIIMDKTGFLVNPSDADDLAAKIDILINDPVLRDEMGSEGKKRVEDFFSVKQMVENYLDLYASLLISRI